MNINSERVKKWREENPDKWKEQQDKWNASQAKKEAHKKWKATHPDYKYTPSESVKENKRKYEATRREKHREIALRSRLKTQYGLTLEEYEKLLEDHEGVCAICGEQENTKRNGDIIRLAIDHDHKTGEIRGLLCDRCNRGLGLFRDSPQLLESAVRYLNEH